MSDNIFRIQSIQKKGNRVEASVQVGESVSTFYIECDDPALVPSREALVALTLFPAMKDGVELQAGGEISTRLVEALPVLQDVYHGWFPEIFLHIPVTQATPVVKKNPNARRVGVFFSGGVDSWYTFIKHRDEITDLILVWGFDIPLDKPGLFEHTRQNMLKVAQEFGKNLVIVKTNLRTFTEPHVVWNWLFGAGMGAVANLLSGGFKRIYTSAGQWYGHQKPAASHVLLDSLWSTETLQVVYTGLEATRLDKVRELAQYDIALQTLRVCWRNPGDVYNCGWCEKCLRTMVALQIVGAYERCSTFRGPINTKRLAKLHFMDEAFLPYLENNLQALRKQPWNKAIYKAERRVLLRYYFKNFLFKVHELYPGIRIGRGRFVKKMNKM